MHNIETIISWSWWNSQKISCCQLIYRASTPTRKIWNFEIFFYWSRKAWKINNFCQKPWKHRENLLGTFPSEAPLRICSIMKPSCVKQEITTIRLLMLKIEFGSLENPWKCLEFDLGKVVETLTITYTVFYIIQTDSSFY